MISVKAMVGQVLDNIIRTLALLFINGTRYNVSCYADYLILISLTLTGLQSLIDVANEHIMSHGLWFNPTKAQCITFGKQFLHPNPTWNIQGITLAQTEAIE